MASTCQLNPFKNETYLYNFEQTLFQELLVLLNILLEFFRWWTWQHESEETFKVHSLEYWQVEWWNVIVVQSWALNYQYWWLVTWWVSYVDLCTLSAPVPFCPEESPDDKSNISLMSDHHYNFTPPMLQKCQTWGVYLRNRINKLSLILIRFCRDLVLAFIYWINNTFRQFSQSYMYRLTWQYPCCSLSNNCL